jgi:hypothetical protein
MKAKYAFNVLHLPWQTHQHSINYAKNHAYETKNPKNERSFAEVFAIFILPLFSHH